MDSKNKMTVGFIFSEDLSKVLLIKKNRPTWQKGFLNGIGGHMNPIEELTNEFESCWVREVEEETGLKLDIDKVIRIGRIVGTENQVIVVIYTYKLSSSEEFNYKCEQLTDEPVNWVTLDFINMADVKIIENLKHLIPLARYTFQQPLLREAKLTLLYK